MPEPLFIDEPDRSGPSMVRTIRFQLLIGTLAVIALIGSIWVFYPRTGSDEPLPVVRAETEPVRSLPEDPGGMRIAHQDSMIFDSFVMETPTSPGSTQAAQPRRIENLLAPQREEPLTREELFAEQQAEETTSGAEQGREQAEVAPSPEETDPRASEISEALAPRKEELINLAPGTIRQESSQAQVAAERTEQNTQPEVIEPSAGSIAVPTAPLPGEGFFVQLASIRDPGKTETSRTQLQQNFAPLLDSVNFRTQDKVISGKGTYYRIQAGPLSKPDAEQLCNNIKAQDGACFIVSE